MDNFLFTKRISAKYFFGEEALSQMGNLCHKYEKLLVFVDELVFSLHRNFIKNILAQSLLDYEVFPLPRGESAKSINLWENLTNQIMSGGLSRKSAVVSIGGGAISDFSGFFASTCMRGLDHIIFPTTVLAMVDAALGGKTAVNNKAGKNMVGTWYFPEAVFFLPAFLVTLTKKELLSGLGEMVKHSLIASEKLFEELKIFPKIINNWQEHSEKSNISLVEKFFSLVISAQKIKIDIVQKDPFQSNLRHILNFGHTAGHALEALSNYKLMHGTAVLQGMRTELEIGLQYFDFPSRDFEFIVSFLDLLLQSTRITADPEDFLKFIQRDKKKTKDSLVISLPSGLGRFEPSSFLKQINAEWFLTTDLFQDYSR